MELRVEDIPNRVPDLLVGAERLHVLFATYRTVDGISPGTVEPKPGLLIDVRSGIDDYSPVASSLLLSPLLAREDELEVAGLLAATGAYLMDQEGQDAQAAVDRGLSELAVPEGHQFLAVCYAGLAAFQQALQSATKMKSRAPGSKVILVTCDCNLAKKRVDLQPHLDEGEIDLLVVTPYCGGEQTMRYILDTIVNSWPGATAT